MDRSERMKLDEEKKRQYLEYAGQYKALTKEIKLRYIALMALHCLVIFLSTYSFFFEILTDEGKPFINFGVIQLLVGLYMAVLTAVCVSTKNKIVLLASAIPVIPLLIFAFSDKTILRASIRNYAFIDISSYLDIKIPIIILCILLTVMTVYMYKCLGKYELLSKVEGFPHFTLRVEKAQEYMPEVYTLPEERSDKPDTLTSDDINRYQEIEKKQSETTYIPGVMDTIGPISLDDDE